MSAGALQAIPAELRELPHWVLWKAAKRDGKKTKLPKQVRAPRSNASSTDPATWATFDEAVSALEAGHGDGIGFVFTGTKYAGVDLDRVRAAAGTELGDLCAGALLPDAEEIVWSFESYAEVSQSGKGVHIIFEGEMPGKGRKVTMDDGFGLPGWETWDIEAYSTGRFFCMTGDVIGDQDEIRECQEELDYLLTRYFTKNGNGKGATTLACEPAALLRGDGELVEMLLSKNNGFAALWSGDTSAYDDDDSRADEALLTHLAWLTGSDAARMDGIFRSSRLYREKWEREDYRERSIAAAIECNAGRCYTGQKQGGSDADVSIPPSHTATVPPEPKPVAAPSIATSGDLLADFSMALHSRGVVGEDRFAKVTYLCLTSRVLARPVSLAAKGPSSAGKSFVVQEVVEFFPESAVYALSSMSEHALAYSQEPLSHRFLILYEAAGLESDFASYLLRSLLSEGCIRYETVEKKKGEGMVPRLIEREGPTGLIVTTTQVSLHPENETRLLSVPANDTREQTAAIIRMLACEDGRGGDGDLGQWRTLQTWIAGQDNRVTIPFAPALADLVPPVAVRLRRDFSTVLNLVKAHAILHQQTRQRDATGRIIATVSDYGIVRDLVADLVADEVGATVPATVVETVTAVDELAAAHKSGVTYQQLGERLGLDKSAARRRAKVATSRGHLKNLEDKRGQPARLVVGEPLPGEVTILPTVETLTGGTVAVRPEGIDTNAQEVPS